MSPRILALLASLLIAASPLPDSAAQPSVADIPAAPMGWVSRTPDDGWTGAPTAGTPSPAAVSPVAHPSLGATGKRPGSEAQPTAKPSAAATNLVSVSREPAPRGVASWYSARPGTAAAGPALREALGPDYLGQSVRVCAGSRCIEVRIVTSCQCYRGEPGERLIDLSRSAFSRLADPSVGLVRVTVEVVR